MCSSLHPVSQAAHCAMRVLPAVGAPYNSGRLKWRSSSIHFEYRFSPYMALHANVLIKDSLHLL